MRIDTRLAGSCPPATRRFDLDEAEWSAALNVTRDAWRSDPARLQTCQGAGRPQADPLFGRFGASELKESRVIRIEVSLVLYALDPAEGRRKPSPWGTPPIICVWCQLFRVATRASRLSTR